MAFNLVIKVAGSVSPLAHGDMNFPGRRKVVQERSSLITVRIPRRLEVESQPNVGNCAELSELI